MLSYNNIGKWIWHFMSINCDANFCINLFEGSSYKRFGSNFSYNYNHHMKYDPDVHVYPYSDEHHNLYLDIYKQARIHHSPMSQKGNRKEGWWKGEKSRNSTPYRNFTQITLFPFHTQCTSMSPFRSTTPCTPIPYFFYPFYFNNPCVSLSGRSSIKRLIQLFKFIMYSILNVGDLSH